jgi:hypothetical protein
MRLVLFSVALALPPGAAVSAQIIERDVPYGGDLEQRLDLYLPATAGFPTVIFVHGGSLTTGDKADEDYRDVCRPFPAAGIGCVSINYRLAPAHPWPSQAEDVAKAIAWVYANIGARAGDPAKLYLFGHSSGATLVALVGTDQRYLAKEHLAIGAVRGVIPMGSIMWDDDLEQAIAQHGRARVEERFHNDPDNAIYTDLAQYLDRWPMCHVGPGLPLFLFLIAEAEQEQPPVLRTNRAFVDRARELGNRADYLVLGDRTHYSAIRRLSEAKDPAFGAVRDFILRRGDR